MRDRAHIIRCFCVNLAGTPALFCCQADALSLLLPPAPTSRKHAGQREFAYKQADLRKS